MRVSYRWLQEYVNVKMPPEILAELLTMSGLSVESVRETGGDHLLEIEVTSNRPDALSLIGIAREVSALTGKRLKLPRSQVTPRLRSGQASHPSTSLRAGKSPVTGKSARGITISIEDRKLCPRYTGRVIEGVTVAQSPRSLAEKIEAMGLRAVNNIVDITNFCLFETGEPMHAFDLDRISGGLVAVRRARKGEKITTIDGVVRALDETVLVIADRDAPIAIAGVMGGLATEVTFATKNILLEAAIFDPVSVRRTSRRLGISTESSYRFERRIDPASVVGASERAAALIREAAHGTPGAFVDRGLKKPASASATLRYGRLNKVLGIAIAPSEVNRILRSLGCVPGPASAGSVRIGIPSFRPDIEKEVDLIEEVVRIYGYGKVPVTVPPLADDPSPRVPPTRSAERDIRTRLVAAGLNEILTYSLLSRKDCAPAGIPGEALLEIENPLSAEQEVMRPSLVPGLLKAIAWNINRKAKEIALFEIGNVYFRDASGRPRETKHLSIGMSGEAQGNWRAPARALDLFDVKGALERLGLDAVAFSSQRHGACAPGTSASISVNGTVAGFMGEASREALSAYDIKQNVAFLEISLEEALPALASLASGRRYRPLPRFPSVKRDLSVVVDEGVENARALQLIREKGGRLVRSVRLLDRYKGPQIPGGKISLTYRIEYVDPSKTLEEAEVNAVHAEVLASLQGELGAKLRIS